MCTLTIVPECLETSSDSAYRLAFNRDEQHTRPIAQLPKVEVHGNKKVILPREPDGGGTWIAVSDAGLAFALLNVNPPNRSGTVSGGLSRGVIIPALLSADSIESVAGMLPTATQEVRRPFRLVVTDGRMCIEAVQGFGRMSCQMHDLIEPIMRSSSGLGDDVVEGPRRSLFESMFVDSDLSPISIQDQFHASRILNHDEQSVDMWREDARTVSTAVITVTAVEIRMVYTPGAPREKAPGVPYALMRSQLPGAA
ncbi:MAG: NRDE family protein [Phycisphaerales bacterium]|nr:NRDE family protein [Phycisphaerales bacterium]